MSFLRTIKQKLKIIFPKNINRTPTKYGVIINKEEKEDNISQNLINNFNYNKDNIHITNSIDENEIKQIYEKGHRGDSFIFIYNGSNIFDIKIIIELCPKYNKLILIIDSMINIDIRLSIEYFDQNIIKHEIDSEGLGDIIMIMGIGKGEFIDFTLKVLKEYDIDIEWTEFIDFIKIKLRDNKIGYKIKLMTTRKELIDDIICI